MPESRILDIHGGEYVKSAFGSKDVAVKSFQVGGMDFLDKPIYLEDLLARVENHLTAARRQRQRVLENERLKQRVAFLTGELEKVKAQLQRESRDT